MQSLIEFSQFLAGLDPVNVLTLLAGITAFVSVLAAWYAVIEPARQSSRITAIAQRRKELEQVRPTGEGRKRRLVVRSRQDEWVKKLRLAQAQKIEEVRNRLYQAGIRAPEARSNFILAKLAFPMILVLLTLFYDFVIARDAIGPGVKMLVLAVSPLVGWYLPDVYVYNLKMKRVQAVQRGLPDSLDLMVVCAEAGLSLDVSFNRVAEEMERQYPEIAEELGITAAEMQLLPERRQALVNLQKRVDLDQVRSVTSTLIQTEKFGTPLAQSLRVLAADFREARLLRAEEKAARLPATLTVPMIVFILPTLFIVLMGPAMIGVYDSFTK